MKLIKRSQIIVDQTKGAKIGGGNIRKPQEDFDLLRYTSLLSQGPHTVDLVDRLFGVDVKSLHDLFTASIQNQPISTASAEDNSQLFSADNNNQHFFS